MAKKSSSKGLVLRPRKCCATSSDLEEIARRPKAFLDTVGGEVASRDCVGYNGALEPSNLGLKFAAYVPNMPT